MFLCHLLLGVRCGLNLLFWNINKHSNEQIIESILQEYDIDIALFAEYDRTDFSSIVKDLNNKYLWNDGFGGCSKVTLLYKDTASIRVRREQGRYSLYSCEFEGNEYIIAGTHLPAPPSNDSNARKTIIRSLVADISQLENELKEYDALVIGDFNCNPFDEELVQKDAFNSVLFKKLIEKTEYVEYFGKRYRRFYNPLLDFVSEARQLYGSYYYSSGSAPIYWNCFDQIIVRKRLANRILDLQYIKLVKGKSLIKQVQPDSEISDHLPLYVKIEKG